MGHKTLIGGTSYDVSKGKVMIGGTSYSIKNGILLKDGTQYGVNFIREKSAIEWFQYEYPGELPVTRYFTTDYTLYTGIKTGMTVNGMTGTLAHDPIQIERVLFCLEWNTYGIQTLSSGNPTYSISGRTITWNVPSNTMFGYVSNIAAGGSYPMCVYKIEVRYKYLG